MTKDYHVASTYLRLMLHTDTERVAKIPTQLSDRLQSALQHDYVTGSLINQLFEAFEQLGMGSWAVEYAQQLGIANHGPVGFAALSAPDLATAMQVLSEFTVIRTSGIINTVTVDEQYLTYTSVDLTEHALSGRWLIESGLLAAQNIIESVTAHPLGNNARIKFAFSKAKNWSAIEDLFHASCEYNASESSLSIPHSWSTIPSPLRDANTFRSNLAKCREIKLDLSADQNDVLRLVYTRLINHFDRRLTNQARSEKIPNLGMLASELHMSQRTLIRKLTKQDSSYKILLDQIRLQYAENLLKNTHLTSAEVAHKLGYLEAANFGRAFRRWTGQSPSNWRVYSNT